MLEIERWQNNKGLNAEPPELCPQQIGTYLVLYETLDHMWPLIDEAGAPTDSEVEQVVSIGRFYREKYAALPRAWVDDLANGVVAPGPNVLGLGLSLERPHY